MSSTKPLLLFDFDGTLVDTETLAIRTTRTYFDSLKIPVAEDLLHYLVGHSWYECALFFRDRLGLAVSAETLEQELLFSYRQGLNKGIDPVPGAEAFLRSLGNRFECCIVSGSRKADLLAVLARLRWTAYFSAVFGYEDYSRPKPDPAPYLTALRHFSALPSQALAFEDSPAGIQAAKLAGLRVVAIESSPHLLHGVSGLFARVANFDGLVLDWSDIFYGVP